VAQASLVGLGLERGLALLHSCRDLFAVRLELVACDLVPVDLAGLHEQDQRCGISGLGREREVEEDEQGRVPAQTVSLVLRTRTERSGDTLHVLGSAATGCRRNRP
jgi:hypothetical protein